MSKRALILLHPGFEELEAVAPVDLLSRAGIDIVQAAVASNEQLVTGRSGITLRATASLDSVKDGTFDAVILPGGPGIHGLRGDERVIEVFRRHHRQGALLACICAAPLLLKDAGLLDGVEYTAHPSTGEELPEARDDATVLSGNILTSRGAGTATRFALALVGELASDAEAGAVAASICAGETTH